MDKYQETILKQIAVRSGIMQLVWKTDSSLFEDLNENRTRRKGQTVELTEEMANAANNPSIVVPLQMSTADMVRQVKYRHISVEDASDVYRGFQYENGTIEITQEEDYHRHEYSFTVFHPFLAEAYLLKGDSKVHGVAPMAGVRHLTLDFDDKSESLILEFRDNIVNPIIIPIVYHDADRSAWDLKVEKDRREKERQIVDPKIATGDTLVNLYFNPFDNTYSHSVVSLYLRDSTNKQMPYRKLADYEVAPGKYFRSITDLAHGDYALVLKQFNSTNELIYESDYLEFKLSRPRVAVYEGKPTVHWP